MGPMDFATLPCTALSGVGPALATRLAKCAIHTVQDLLFHLPYRYQDRTRITPIALLKAGEHAVIEGTITHLELTQRRTPMLVCHLQDDSGQQIALRFFHFYPAQQKQLAPGTRLRCFGEVNFWQRELEMIHPEYHLAVQAKALPLEATLTPIYPATEGLSQQSLRRFTEAALQLLERNQGLTELLPQHVLNSLRLPDLISAIKYVHRPPIDAPLALLEQGQHPAQQRLAFEELLAQHLSLRCLRQANQAQPAPCLKAALPLQEKFLAALPFALTAAQQRVIAEISADLAQAQPMLRLVQGDVGSGKTVVAAFAALAAISSGYQVAIMAPTELLAEQHATQFRNWLTPLQINVDCLTSKITRAARKQKLSAIASGDTQVVLGTHAVFQEEVSFAKLGLVIVDEQHRFGVHQRLSLWHKGIQNGYYPHQLIMTATPIPRTLAMTAYADLAVSVIDELPTGRTPIDTIVVPDTRRPDIIARIQAACQAKRQVYWVCTLIEESEALIAQAAATTAQTLQQALPMVKIGLIHGRLKPTDKAALMAQFKAGELDLLVATTVIEVGVDVPNASLMIIENAERLGLAQLHQLRGRVGRGATKSYCVLLYQSPLSELARSRLQIVRDSQDGFAIAEQDLLLRGPGEILGTRQTGVLQFRIANLVRDQALLPEICRIAELLLREDYPHINALISRWTRLSEQYGSV